MLIAYTAAADESFVSCSLMSMFVERYDI